DALRTRPAPLFLRVSIRDPPRSPLFPYTTLFRFLDAGQPPGDPPRGTVVLARAHPAGPAHPPGGRPARHRSRPGTGPGGGAGGRSEEHTSERQAREKLVCRPPLVKRNPAFG